MSLRSRLIKHKLLIATTNKGKAREFRALFKGLPLSVFTLSDLGSFTPFEEKGDSFLDIASGKSLFYNDRWKDHILGEDSGLEIDFLEGAPGIYSARFSGLNADDEKNIRKVLSLMKNAPSDKRQARFISCMVLSKKGKVLKAIEEFALGSILQEKKGTGGFGYDPIFYYPPLEKTFAQLDPEIKNQVSHRGKAFKILKDYIKENILD